MTGDRRLTLLAALLVALIAYFGWTRGASLFNRGAGDGLGGAVRARTVVGAEIVELRVDELEQKPGTYRPGRDLFRYGRAAVETRPPVQRKVSPPPPKPPPPTVEFETPPEPQPPPIDVVYLGSFGRTGRMIAVFADDEAIYNARVGDVVKEVFVLVAIGYESADLGFVGFPDVAAERLAAGGSENPFLR